MADPTRSLGTQVILAAFAILIASSAFAQALYKYRGENGEWIYADRPPVDGDVDEIRDLTSPGGRGTVTVKASLVGQSVQFVASNRYHVPIEMALRFKLIEGLDYPPLDVDPVWVLPPRSTTTVLDLDVLQTAKAPNAQYEYEFVAGDPGAAHRPIENYRVPYAIATNYPITQAYPDVITHTTPDSYHAIDIAMPIGTDVFAARGGVVFDVSANNFRSGVDPEKDGPAANVVQILHDDGTYAVYAHLNWNSIRVRVGDEVERGEYIADSGNTGFSTGPHLHFAVLRNAGMRVQSVPVRFDGADSNAITPATGYLLTAY